MNTEKLSEADCASAIIDHAVDPQTPLSDLDVVKWLMNNTSVRVAELKDNITECMREDRSHFKELVELAVNGYTRKFDCLENSISQSITKIVTAVTDLDLKVNTISSYQELLIQDIHRKIYEITHETPSASTCLAVNPGNCNNSSSRTSISEMSNSFQVGGNDSSTSILSLSEISNIKSIRRKCVANIC